MEANARSSSGLASASALRLARLPAGPDPHGCDRRGARTAEPRTCPDCPWSAAGRSPRADRGQGRAGDGAVQAPRRTTASSENAQAEPPERLGKQRRDHRYGRFSALGRVRERHPKEGKRAAARIDCGPFQD
jgi:hypothetical protein